MISKIKCKQKQCINNLKIIKAPNANLSKIFRVKEQIITWKFHTLCIQRFQVSHKLRVCLLTHMENINQSVLLNTSGNNQNCLRMNFSVVLTLAKINIFTYLQNLNAISLNWTISLSKNVLIVANGCLVLTIFKAFDET